MPNPRRIIAVVVALVPACTSSLEPFVQQTYVKASNSDSGDDFGGSITLSADGKTLAVGAFRESNPARGINQSDDNIGDTGSSSGAVYLGRRVGAVPWFGESLFPTMSVPQS